MIVCSWCRVQLLKRFCFCVAVVVPCPEKEFRVRTSVLPRLFVCVMRVDNTTTPNGPGVWHQGTVPTGLVQSCVGFRTATHDTSLAEHLNLIADAFP